MPMTTDEYRKIDDAFTLSFDQLREGDGYDLDALDDLSEAGREYAISRAKSNMMSKPSWREIQVFEKLNATAELRKALNHAEASIRFRAALALQDDEPRLLATMVQRGLAAGDREPEEFDAAMDFAEYCEPDEVTRDLVRLMRHEKPEVYLEATRMLLSIHDVEDLDFWDLRNRMLLGTPAEREHAIADVERRIR
jgi:hypothetical protein